MEMGYCLCLPVSWRYPCGLESVAKSKKTWSWRSHQIWDPSWMKQSGSGAVAGAEMRQKQKQRRNRRRNKEEAEKKLKKNNLGRQQVGGSSLHRDCQDK